MLAQQRQEEEEEKEEVLQIGAVIVLFSQSPRPEEFDLKNNKVVRCSQFNASFISFTLKV